ncbi:uncharacterized protein BO88DRAFT_427396 [Aspergillus vadensis CBS 113365]|uniref:Uncharacterized protein n=1 Tax=Aspergillus vadensis (strain CBS 113365 / IMI 142717 / IBT 24658) TaxID=1448311 RepID=A0A319B4S2_ASPVC|nr:hypothetical protein BO88DRAFT_427396 [Aspergillus vadensis CBS 113365]PYH66784.1 hypothetical protein BO88DRAFT_427396 [Aspergillus vadensis CBS 113365]
MCHGQMTVDDSSEPVLGPLHSNIIIIIITTTKVPVKSRHASGASLSGPQGNPTRHGSPLSSARSSACRNKAVSRGAYAFEKVGKGWTTERSNPGKFDSFTISSWVLDPLSEPCSGPTQSTPQLVLYLMEGCYELAGSGTTRDRVDNLGTTRLGFHLSGNIEHLRSLFSGGSVSSIPLVIRYPFYFLLCTKDAVDQLRREGLGSGRKSLLISAGAHRPDNFGTLAVCIDPGRRRPMSTITVSVPLGIDLDPRGRIS